MSLDGLLGTTVTMGTIVVAATADDDADADADADAEHNKNDEGSWSMWEAEGNQEQRGDHLLPIRSGNETTCHSTMTPTVVDPTYTQTSMISRSI